MSARRSSGIWHSSAAGFQDRVLTQPFIGPWDDVVAVVLLIATPPEQSPGMLSAAS
jgi:hypothetical protein